MGQFLKTLLASCLGTLIALVAISLISVAVVGQLATKMDQAKPTGSNSVLRLTFDQPLPERTNNLEMNPFDLKTQKVLGLQDLIQVIQTAKEDPKIKGIFLDIQGYPGGQATISSINEAVQDFKSDGKFVVAYSKFYTQGTYFLALPADEIYLNPMGGLDFRGYGAIIPFFKNMLDKIGVDMQVVYAGKFKSATEPYRFTQMSDENRTQMREFIDAMYLDYLERISAARNLPVNDLRQIADELKLRTAQDAQTYGLVDRIGYRDQVFSDLRERLGLAEEDEISFVSSANYLSDVKPKDYSVKDKIAVVYAEGNIVMGEGEPGSVADDAYMRMLREVRQDDQVKALVLRVNSPGGSVLASENIWRELQLIQEAGIPLVVSMGDYAASGGYYIACSADSILTEPNTLTGSIGVFAVLPDVSGLMNNKLGITFDTVNTGNYSTGLTPVYPLTDAETALLQESVDEVYQIFLQKVADGRNMTIEEVHAIAQGRVWTGKKAVELGLADRIGSLEEAITAAAALAGLEKYRTTEYPRIKEPFQQFLEELTGTGTEDIRGKILQRELGEYAKYYDYLKALQETEGVQARLPFLFEIR